MPKIDKSILKKLKFIADNYYWSTSRSSIELFSKLSTKLSGPSYETPSRLLYELQSNPKLFDNAEISELTLESIEALYDEVFRKTDQFKSRHQLSDTNDLVAYFSPEYAIHESLPMYAGGLGILAGDHFKTASDMDLNMLGIGLFYNRGYIKQSISGYEQISQSEDINVHDYPIHTIQDDEGSDLLIHVDFPNGPCYAAIRSLAIGNCMLYLLDTNIEANDSEEFRSITSHLYGGERDVRLQQEMLLGIGGIQALKAMKISPKAVHINEGHAAFSLLEKARIFSEEKQVSFQDAVKLQKASNTFTTHTPVIHGNEEFDESKIRTFFSAYVEQLGISMGEFIALGQNGIESKTNVFSMSVLAIKLSGYINGVSKLHGETSRNMWKHIWHIESSEDVPIDHITNGIHINSWLSRELFERISDEHFQADLSKLNNLSDSEITDIRNSSRKRLIDFINIKQNRNLDANVLVIGFARRFAPYKRADLIFKDMERFAKILNNAMRPVLYVLAGKAHPKDVDGLKIIHSILKKIDKYNLHDKVIFLENYNIEIGRLMTEGCDVWLNTPLRPKEACGTSGMKSMLNGGVNVSIDDGWWHEAFSGKNGFKLNEYDDRQTQLATLYDTLENQVIETFYENKGQPLSPAWIDIIREGWKSIPYFDAERMLREYAEKAYQVNI